MTAIETDIIENFETINSKARTQESFFTKISGSRPTWDTEVSSSEGNTTSSEKKLLLNCPGENAPRISYNQSSKKNRKLF